MKARALAFGTAGLLLMWPWGGGPGAPPEHIGAISAQDCSGTLIVTYQAQRLIGGAWVLLRDDGGVTLQVHDYSGRSGPDGMWLDEPDAVSGGEGQLRWPILAHQHNGLHVDLARVVRRGIASVPVPIEVGCR